MHITSAHLNEEMDSLTFSYQQHLLDAQGLEGHSSVAQTIEHGPLLYAQTMVKLQSQSR